MAYTLAQYNALVESIALGATTVQYVDRTVTFRSLREMKQVKQEMEAELFPSTAPTAESYRVKMTFDKGL